METPCHTRIGGHVAAVLTQLAVMAQEPWAVLSVGSGCLAGICSRPLQIRQLCVCISGLLSTMPALFLADQVSSQQGEDTSFGQMKATCMMVGRTGWWAETQPGAVHSEVKMLPSLRTGRAHVR